jgi:hypothetical protein
MLKVLQAFYAIMTKVQFLQISECFKVFDFSNAVRLQREDPETFQSAKIL